MTHLGSSSAASTVILIAALGSACGAPQASPSYPGEALLLVQGSIQLDDTELAKDAVPVLTWGLGVEQESFLRMRVQNVAVSGEFPSKFTLSVHAPPEASVLDNTPVVRELEDEPRMTFAYIAALPAEHDEDVVLGTKLKDDESCVFNEEDSALETCTETLCDYYDQCFTQTIECVGDECGVTSVTGSTSVQNGLGILSGFVNDYVVLYLHSAAAPGSLVAWQLGESQLPAGYHLFRLLPGQGEEAAKPACLVAAEEAAAARVAQVYGDAEGEGPELAYALALYTAAAGKESGCAAARFTDLERVEVSERLTMTLGSELTLPH